MKTIGLLGGMSWESTAVYYRLINQAVRNNLGGLHSAELVLWSFDFEPIAQLQREEKWDDASQKIAAAGLSLRTAGAKALVLCTNTMHKLADHLEHETGLPLLHIADATAQAIQKSGIKKVGLLATRFTMEQDFYSARLRDRFGIDVLIPDPIARERVHAVIYEELCKGIVSLKSRDEYLNIIRQLANNGAEAIILGCTEIGLLISQQDVDIPIFDSTTLHAEAAAEWSLKA